VETNAQDESEPLYGPDSFVSVVGALMSLAVFLKVLRRRNGEKTKMNDNPNIINSSCEDNDPAKNSSEYYFFFTGKTTRKILCYTLQGFLCALLRITALLIILRSSSIHLFDPAVNGSPFLAPSSSVNFSNNKGRAPLVLVDFSARKNTKRKRGGAAEEELKISEANAWSPRTARTTIDKMRFGLARTSQCRCYVDSKHSENKHLHVPPGAILRYNNNGQEEFYGEEIAKNGRKRSGRRSSKYVPKCFDQKHLEEHESELYGEMFDWKNKLMAPELGFNYVPQCLMQNWRLDSDLRTMKLNDNSETATEATWERCLYTKIRNTHNNDSSSSRALLRDDDDVHDDEKSLEKKVEINTKSSSSSEDVKKQDAALFTPLQKEEGSQRQNNEKREQRAMRVFVIGDSHTQTLAWMLRNVLEGTAEIFVLGGGCIRGLEHLRNVKITRKGVDDHSSAFHFFEGDVEDIEEDPMISTSDKNLDPIKRSADLLDTTSNNNNEGAPSGVVGQEVAKKRNFKLVSEDDDILPMWGPICAMDVTTFRKYKTRKLYWQKIVHILNKKLGRGDLIFYASAPGVQCYEKTPKSELNEQVAKGMMKGYADTRVNPQKTASGCDPGMAKLAAMAKAREASLIFSSLFVNYEKNLVPWSSIHHSSNNKTLKIMKNGNNNHQREEEAVVWEKNLNDEFNSKSRLVAWYEREIELLKTRLSYDNLHVLNFDQLFCSKAAGGRGCESLENFQKLCAESFKNKEADHPPGCVLSPIGEPWFPPTLPGTRLRLQADRVHLSTAVANYLTPFLCSWLSEKIDAPFLPETKVDVVMPNYKFDLLSAKHGMDPYVCVAKDLGREFPELLSSFSNYEKFEKNRLGLIALQSIIDPPENAPYLHHEALFECPMAQV